MSRRTEIAYKAEPQGESAPQDETHPEHWGMVNAAVVWGQSMCLPGELCPPRWLNRRLGTAPAKVRVNKAEVSRGRELNPGVEERSEGSVVGDGRKL